MTGLVYTALYWCIRGLDHKFSEDRYVVAVMPPDPSWTVEAADVVRLARAKQQISTGTMQFGRFEPSIHD